MRPETALLIIRHAVENASIGPIDDAGILAILRGMGGHSSHLMAVFGDASLQAIYAAGAGAGIGPETILAAYAEARRTAAAANPELDAALREQAAFSAEAGTPDAWVARSIPEQLA